MKYIKPVFTAGILLLANTLTYAQPQNLRAENAPGNKENTMQITMEIDGEIINASLENGSSAAADFYAMLPLTLTLTDYASTEKVSDLPGKLSTRTDPAGTSAKAGDITYYAPWGNLAIFYKNFGHANGLVKLGTMESGVDLLKKHKGAFEVVIKAAD
tara:strand:- start:187 stop:660 length:474 start_codon:yes stop_codon:yes gene_type:complete